MAQLETRASIRETVLRASEIADGFSDTEKIVVSEALTHLIATQYDVPAGHPTLRLFTMIMRIKPIPDTQVGVFAELRALEGIV